MFSSLSAAWTACALALNSASVGMFSNDVDGSSNRIPAAWPLTLSLKDAIIRSNLD